MFLRSASPTRAGSSDGSGREDLRRQLEGGLEVIAAALERYRVLSSALGRRGWKAKLRLQPGVLEAAAAREPEVLEALEALRRRAAREPDGTGMAGALLRELEAARKGLAADIARRLPVGGVPLLSERLARLKAVALQPLPLPPGEGEQLLLEGHEVLPPPGLFLLFLALGAGVARLASPWAAVPLLALAFAVTFQRSGRYWLTTERLLWQPRGGDPVQVSLASIGDCTQAPSGRIERNLSVNRLTGSVTVHRQGVTLRHVPRAGLLAALLAIRRRKEFRGAAASRDPQRIVAVIPVFRSLPEDAFGVTDSGPDGLLVLRPGFVAYFSNRAASDILDAITEPEQPTTHVPGLRRDEVPLSTQQLVSQLLLLPEEEQDRMLRKLASLRNHSLSTDLLVCGPEETQCDLNIFLQTLQLSHGDSVLWANLSGEERQHITRVLSFWPAAR
jgi:hypothetical protein